MSLDPADVLKAFTSYDVQMSLFDQARVALFQSAIAATVRPGDVVVDGGSGTGLLGMLAARAGAARVYCVELSDEYTQVIRENARRNDLADVIVAINADATAVELSEPVDVIVCDVMSAGFFYEPHLAVIDNLLRFLKPTGRIIPAAAEQFVDLADAQEDLYGLKFTYESRWKILDDRPLTETVRYHHTDFRGPGRPPERMVVDAVAKTLGDGRANAVRVSYHVHFTEDIIGTMPSEFLLNPQIIFLPEPIQVAAGEAYSISLDYRIASNPRDCGVRVSRL